MRELLEWETILKFASTEESYGTTLAPKGNLGIFGQKTFYAVPADTTYMLAYHSANKYGC